MLPEMYSRTDAREALETLFTFLGYQSFRFLLQNTAVHVHRNYCGLKIGYYVVFVETNPQNH